MQIMLSVAAKLLGSTRQRLLMYCTYIHIISACARVRSGFQRPACTELKPSEVCHAPEALLYMPTECMHEIAMT